LLGIAALICLIMSALTVAPTLKFGFPKAGLIAFVPLVLSFPVYLVNFRWCRRVGSIAMWVVTCCTSITGAMAGVLGMEIIPIAFLVIASLIASFVDLRSKSPPAYNDTSRKTTFSATSISHLSRELSRTRVRFGRIDPASASRRLCRSLLGAEWGAVRKIAVDIAPDSAVSLRIVPR
jgi:hypothetical protein